MSQLQAHLDSFESHKRQLTDKPIRGTIKTTFKAVGTAVSIIDIGLDMALDEVIISRLEHKAEVLTRLNAIIKQPTKTKRSKA